MTVRKFEMVADSKLEPRAKAGTIVYDYTGCTYGLVGDDTRMTGIEHCAVTLDPEGGNPFFTVPETAIREIKE